MPVIKLPQYRKLPCYPCPHNSSCCNYGTDLTQSETEQIIEAKGLGAVVASGDGYRTAVVAGQCIFVKDNTCSIHGESYYPVVCRGFPWVNDTGGPYEGDITICPEPKDIL